ncbi:MAG: serine hydrolase [Myxococcales bacterium]|nr:serine hydrolase [Myxococcales bacterium]
MKRDACVAYPAFVRWASLLSLALAGCGGDQSPANPTPLNDPGVAAWELVPRDRVAEECGLDPVLLEAADQALDFPWAVVRHGKLCHEHYPDGADVAQELFSATKTLGAVVVGAAVYRTRDIPRTDRKTGPLSDEDRVDHWLDAFDFNPDAQVGHVLAMVAHNADLGFGSREFSYDAIGTVQINRLNDIVKATIAQDPANLGSTVEEFTQRFLFRPLGMTDSSWNGGMPDKPFAFSWSSTVRDMARLGLLILNGGVWAGERLLDEEWIDKMTHPAFEDANTGYGYLTWLISRSNYVFAATPERRQGPEAPCTPAAIWPAYPHGLSDALDCGYDAPWTCAQDYDVGVWSANGAGGQLIVGHPGLDMVLVAKRAGANASYSTVWDPVRPALVALDPMFAGDEDAFCEAYKNNAHAPDLRP